MSLERVFKPVGWYRRVGANLTFNEKGWAQFSETRPEDEGWQAVYIRSWEPPDPPFDEKDQM